MVDVGALLVVFNELLKLERRVKREPVVLANRRARRHIRSDARERRNVAGLVRDVVEVHEVVPLVVLVRLVVLLGDGEVIERRAIDAADEALVPGW